jgi:hypothetical protein
MPGREGFWDHYASSTNEISEINKKSKKTQSRASARQGKTSPGTSLTQRVVPKE